MHSLRRVYYILFILQTLAWTSCQKNNRPSVLVIALDKLSSDMVTCTDEINEEKSGLSLLCKQSIRFTHSYTPSTQPAAAMGSLLTGEYPMKHKLFRSFDRIDHQMISVAKTAKENNYVTSFFSGSPFILKKTGLSDYFDLFDDSIASTPNEYDQDFKQQAQSFFQWVNYAGGGSRHPFFSIIYNSELNKLSITETDQSAFEKIDEKLHQFFLDMKSEGLWDNTYVVVVGLNGSNRFNRYNLNALTNLHSENTNVATLIKLPRQKGDEGINWKNDLRISLTDLGYTLHCLMRPCSNSIELFPVINLAEIWKTQNSEEMKKVVDRPILVQTTTTFPQNFAQHRFSILHSNYNFIQSTNTKFEIFNTISDKSELTDLSRHKNENISESQIYLDYVLALENKSMAATPESEESLRSFENLAQLNLDYWTLPNSKEAVLQQSADEHNPLSYYVLQKASRQKLSKAADGQFLKIRTEILQRNSCVTLNIRYKITKDDLKQCTDDLFLQYLLYTHANDLDLSQEKNKLLYSVMKTTYKNNLNRLSMNLAFNNAWGLYNGTTNLLHPLIFIDNTFFDH